MKETTRKRYERIRQAAAHMYGTMPVMQLYACLAADFDCTEESIRKILAKQRLVKFTNKRVQKRHIFVKNFEYELLQTDT